MNEVVQDGVDLSAMDLIHKNEKGHIAIQRNDYRKPAYFRNIRIGNCQNKGRSKQEGQTIEDGIHIQ